MTDPLIPIHLQLIAAAVLVAFLWRVVYLVRQERLSIRDSLLWLVSTGVAVVATVFPFTLRWTADLLGFELASNAVFALAFVYVLLNLLSLTIAVSGNAARVRRLSQECALLRGELEELKSRGRAGSG